METEKKYLTFFHNSDHQYDDYFNRELFRPRLREENRAEDLRPVFYWFSDSWHSTFPGSRDRFFYLFVKNPKESNIQLRSRHEGHDFHGLYSDYLVYLEERKTKDLSKLYGQRDHNHYCEPSILMSFSDVTPDLMAKYDEEKDIYVILRPESHRFQTFDLFDENKVPIPFNKIKEIASVVPNINFSHPFIEHPLIDG